MNIFLNNRTYRNFTLASFLSNLGDVLFYLALVTYASKLHNYSLAISLIAISEALPKVFSTIGGYYADKTKNKFNWLICMAIIRTLLYLIVGFLFATKLNSWYLVLFVIGINAISDSLGVYSNGLTSPLIVDIVGEENYVEASGFTVGINQVISMAAQFLGSGLLLFMSFANLAFINASTFLLAGFLFFISKNTHQEIKNASPLPNEHGFFKSMIVSLKQMKSADGLLTTILLIALLNGILSAIEPLAAIIIAGNKNMIISTYSFTIALIGVAAGLGMALGSIFGSQIFKNPSLPALVVISLLISIIMSYTLIMKNIYLLLMLYFLLASVAGLASVNLEKWLVVTVDRNILATSGGMLNTLLIIVAPIMTTILTTLSGIWNVHFAIVILIISELITLLVSINLTVKMKK